MKIYSHAANQILEIKDPSLLPLILHSDVRTVIWKRKVKPAVEKAVEIFAQRSVTEIFDMCKNGEKIAHDRGFDPDQTMINPQLRRLFPELQALWLDRQHVQHMLQKMLSTQFILNPLQVQPAQRHTVDHIFHQDRGTLSKKMSQKSNLKVIATLAHAQGGTVFIPQEDAGRQTPDIHGGRRFFHHPYTLKNAVQADTHDVALTKTGPYEGCVHKAPYTRSGIRLLSFLISRDSYKDLRGKFELEL